MDAAFRDLADALRERIKIIADREHYERDAAGHLQRLQAVSERITRLEDALPKPLEGDFAHYLHRASYAKALAWLEARGC